MDFVWAFLVGCAVATVAGWALFGVMLRYLRADLQVAQEAKEACAKELAAVRDDAEAWRERLQVEQVACARLETDALRIPGLENRIEALSDEILRLRASN